MLMVFSFYMAGCDSSGLVDNRSGLEAENCIIPINEIEFGGVGKDGIPALTSPRLVGASSNELSYLDNESRVIGVLLNGTPLAVPHNILWYHEIVNLDEGDEQIAVSYCPLTGSSIAFDRTPHGGAGFGVSGLLWRNNLIMYDRNTEESLWPQMARAGGCGEEKGTPLQSVAATEMTWEAWKALYPDTRVLSGNTGHFRNYARSGYPYGNYEAPDNSVLLFPQPVNEDRSPKERVLGIPAGTGGKVYPFFELDNDNGRRAVNDTVDGNRIVIFWDEAGQGASAFQALVDGRMLTFQAEAGEIIDRETGSTWNHAGLAMSGELIGTQLLPVADAYVAFWFAWKAFHPDLEIWTDVIGV